MSKDNDFNSLLEKIYLKIDSINTLDEADLLEFKNKVREIDTSSLSSQTIENFNRLSDRLNEIEENNNLLSTNLSTLVATSTDILNKLSNKDEYSTAKMEEFLTELAFQIQNIKDAISAENSVLSTDMINNIVTLKNNSELIVNHLDNITNIQNLLLTNAEFEEHQKNAAEESFSNLKEQLSFLQDNLKKQISVILENIFNNENEPYIEKIKGIKDKLEVLDNNAVEQTSIIIKEIQGNFTNTKYTDSLNKISIIYDNLSKMEKWLDNFSDSIDLSDVAEKVDILYENSSIVNEWARRLDDLNKLVNGLNDKYDELNEENRLDDAVNKVDIIYENISLMNEWAIKIDGLSNEIGDIKAKLEALSNDFLLITSSSKGDPKDYVYSLLDIESDFAKLHCLFDESNKNADNELKSIRNQFEIFQDDISSISKRTNKLIVSSDIANKQFLQQVESLKTIVDEFGRKTSSYNPLQHVEILDKKLAAIKKLTMSSLKSDQVINEAFMHLAQWVDSAGEAIEEIRDYATSASSDLQTVKEYFDNVQAQLENVQTQNVEIIQKIESISQDKTELLGNMLEQLTDNFNSQGEKIESLESKIVEMGNIDENSEMKSVLDFIASQMIAVNENAMNSKVLAQKIETVEQQLNKFEKNIARLVSYLDED